VRGVLKGAPNGQVQVVNVSPDSRIKAGEPLVTSGGDQIFPRGMPVGTVDRVVPDPDRDPLVDVLIHPAANLDRLEEVLVVTSIGDMASPQSEKDLAMSEAEGLAAQKRASDILSERLPNRVDPNAPADTNPVTGEGTAGPVQMPQPVRTLHPDGFSPSAATPASGMTPGQRTVPVKYGTEDLPPRKTTPAPSSNSAATSQPATASGSEGAAIPAAPRKPVTATEGEHPAVTVPRTNTGTSGTTSVPRLATSDATAGAATSAERPAHPVTPKPQTPAAGGLQPQTGTRVIVDGPESPAQHRTQQPSTQPGVPRQTTPKPAGQGTATPGATSPKPANPGAANPGTAKSGTATTPHRGPVLVPDDGSKPPIATKPRPESQNPPPANPPQQRENR
jgi:rod shape-determining protein MreC